MEVAVEEFKTQSSLEKLERWVPEDLRDQYWKSVAHLKTIPPDDEILNLIEIMGIIGTIMKQIPSEIASERMKFREEFAAISKETQLLLDQATTQSVQITQNLEKMGSSVQEMAQACEKSTCIIIDSMHKAATRVDIKSIGDRLSNQVFEQSIKPVSALNDRLEQTRQVLSKLNETMKRSVDSFNKTKWWIPWLVSFSVCTAIFTLFWYSYQTAQDKEHFEVRR